MRAEAGATKPAVGHVLGELADVVRTGAQVDVQDGAHVSKGRHVCRVANS